MSTYERPFGRCLEDFVVGDVYRHWPGKTITEADDHLFCLITMNHHPLHLDAWYAEHDALQGRNVVVGNLVYSVVLGMSVPDVSGSAIANLEVESLIHRHPTYHGDTIYAESECSMSGRPSRSPIAASSPSRPRVSTKTESRSATSVARSWSGPATRRRPVGAPTVTTSGRSDVVAFRRALRRAAPGLQRDLPWLNDPRPWAILVSEVMLQQTSTSRVKEPWARFLELFPTPVVCADSPLSTVLVAWSGLGYPRRAKALHGAARVIRDDFGGLVPESVDDLLRLPGVGPYTAHAVATFAFAKPVAVLDTNVGRVLARALANAPLRRGEAQRLADELLPERHPASFNQAMLDLGAQYCRAAPLCESCPVKRHCTWQGSGGSDPAPVSAAVSRRQAPFVGSNREQRGRVLRLLADGPRSKRQLVTHPGIDIDRANEVLESLVHDGLVTKSSRWYSLSEGGDHTRP